MTDKRPDEIDDFRIQSPDYPNDSVNDIELEVQFSKEPSEEASQSEKGWLKKACLRIFCGYEKSQLDGDESNEKMLKKQTETESRRRVDNFYSLNRTKFEACFLNMNLCIILLIAIGLYVFFSVPHQLFHFEHNAMNVTSL